MDNKSYVSILKSIASDIDLENIQDGNVVKLALHILDNPKFQYCSGSSHPNLHHYGTGKLIEHTYEVVKTCLVISDQYPQYNIDIVELFLSALYHDFGKIYDYELFEGEWISTKHKYKIHHISRSCLLWNEALSKLNLDGNFIRKYRDLITHNILSHHGKREWGSPVEPQTKVAWLLHLSDSISARLYDVDTRKT